MDRKTNSKLILITITAVLVLLCAGGVSAGEFVTSSGRFPNTEFCIDQPTIDFPSSTTISKKYLMVTHCPDPVDFNSGDFVTVWIEDMEGSPIQGISKSVETDTGIVWTSPLSDNVGQAWEYIDIDASQYDCNSTGIDYNIVVSWDNEVASKIFKVYCPVLTLDWYKSEVPWTEGFIATVSVTDNVGNRMKGIPCSSDMIFIEDENTTTIRQRTEVVNTDKQGKAEFPFDAGFTSSLYINYDYDIIIECLGADVNFAITVIEPDSAALRNPLYYALIWFSDNWVPIIFGMVLLGFVILIVYKVLTREG